MLSIAHVVGFPYLFVDIEYTVVSISLSDCVVDPLCDRADELFMFPYLLLAHSKNELMQWPRRPSSVCLSVRPSVNFCANRFFLHANGRIATKLAHDGLHLSLHPGCAEGQGQVQRSRDTRTFLDSWNELLRH